MRDYALGTTFDLKFTTRAFATGVPTTLAGTPAIAAYPDNSTTEITAGITLSVDFDSRTGLNNVRVVASGGNGYAAGSNYALVITAGTVGGTSVVGEVIGEFSIEAQSPLRPATAGRTLVVDAAGLADANTVKVGPTGSGTAQTAGDIIGDTNDIQTRLPAALVSGRMNSDVGAMQNNTVTAAALATDAVTEIVAGVFAKAFAAKYAALTFEEAIGVILASQAGITSGAGTGTFRVRDLLDSSDVVVASVSGGNRTSTTVTP